MMCTLVIILSAVAVSWIIWSALRASEYERIDAHRRVERARIQRVQRQSEAQIDALTQAALQEMVRVATPHGAFCRCSRCAGREVQR